MQPNLSLQYRNYKKSSLNSKANHNTDSKPTKKHYLLSLNIIAGYYPLWVGTKSCIYPVPTRKIN